jgi:chromate transporter
VAGTVALLAVFTPGFLLLAAVLPAWDRVAAHPSAGRAIAGVNAAVVGLLAAALFDPVLPSAIASAADTAIIAVAFAAQRLMHRPTFGVLAVCLLGALWTS